MKQETPRLFKQRAWIASLALLAWASLSPGASTSAKSSREKHQPIIKVGIYNYANIGQSELRRAERQADTFFANAHVRIAWSEYSGKRRSVPSAILAPDLCIRIRYASRILRSWRTSNTDALGQSIIARGTQWTVPGRIANVFYDRVEHVASLWGLFPGEVLGNAMAHEMGHLLLGPEHSREGIMKADWASRDLELASQGGLKFSARQVAALQRAARSLRQNPSLTVAAQR
jgi:hypothetical protein